MTTFTIDADHNITAFPTSDHAEAAVAAGAQSFTSQADLAKLATEWPTARLVDSWNGFAGVAPFSDLKPVKKFTDRKSAVARIWQAVQKLAPAQEGAAVTPQGAQGASEVGRSKVDSTSKRKPHKAQKGADKAKTKAAKPGKAVGGREGSKSAKVVELIGRAKGATLAELMKATGWQPHSVRGFISGALGTKMGLNVDSSKREDGERVYTLVR